MGKIGLVAWREFSTRVRKKSFKVMTLLGPVIFAGILIVPIWLKSSVKETGSRILVLDNSGIFKDKFGASEQLYFSYLRTSLEDAKLRLLTGSDVALLFIPPNVVGGPERMVLYSKKKLPLRILKSLQETVSKQLFLHKVQRILSDKHIDPPQEQLYEIKNESLAVTFDEETGDAAGAAGLFLAVLIYFFILLYGMQVMRSVMEEKNSRVVEILISAIKPFELMMGKIIGVAMVSLLQFLVWIVSTGCIASLLYLRFGKSLQLFNDDALSKTLARGTDMKQALEMNELINAFHGLEPLTLLLSFFVFFVGGYLLYSSLFASIGAVVDSETDVQQFVMPVTMPLFLSFILLSAVVEQPQGNLAVWLSMVPFTSPVVMMVRLPYGVPPIELIVSLLILVCSFFLSTWCAAKIYRTGILMHGKKISYAEIGKWLFAKGNA